MWIARASARRPVPGSPSISTVAVVGATSRIHTAKILRLSEDLPIVIEIVDQTERIEAFLPKLDEMVQEGMITLERVQIIAYRHGASESESQS